MEENLKNRKNNSSAVFKTGAISLAFLIIGYQAALFVHRAAALRIEANRDSPDTVYVYRSAYAEAEAPAGTAGTAGPRTDSTVRRNAPHSQRVQEHRELHPRVESFRFNPNTVSVEDLCRLGFSPGQAQAIDNYRQKGGRFRRKSDFAKSFVVSDSVYRRLEEYIDIPLIDINKADSAAFDSLPGIGPYFASQMVSYRTKLGGYSYAEQLMDIYRFDSQKFDGLKDLVSCSPPKPFALWTLPEEDLGRHPYIPRRAARGIVLFRENTPKEEWSVEALASANIIPDSLARKLARCAIAPAE